MLRFAKAKSENYVTQELKLLMMKTDVAVSSVGIISTPNQPMYRRFSVE
jgi:hypothetical protein